MAQPFFRFQLTFMATYVKFDDGERIIQSMSATLTSTERSINPQNSQFIVYMIKTMISECEAHHYALEHKGFFPQYFTSIFFFCFYSLYNK